MHLATLLGSDEHTYFCMRCRCDLSDVCTYILVTALLSPAMLGSQAVGGGTVVLTWLFSAAIFSYVKVCVAGICRDSGYLFSCGVVTQVGSAVGALVMFLLVNQVNLPATF